MTYVKTNWENGKTPINATNLNKIEEGIANAVATDSEARISNVVSRNLFNKNTNTSIEYSVYPSVLNNGIRVITKLVAQNCYLVYKLSNELLGKTITLSSNIIASSSNQGMARIYFGNSSNYAVTNLVNLETSGSVTATLPSSFTDDTDGIYLLLYGNRNGSGYSVGDYVDYTNLQIEEGLTPSNFVPYLNLEEAMQNSKIQKISVNEILTMKEGFTLLNSDYIYKDRNRYFGDIVIQKNTGSFSSTQDEVATMIKKTMHANNTGCFISNSEWSTTNVAYAYIAPTKIIVCDHNNNGCKCAKIHLDIVVNE